jgi:hypothetical protein
VTPRANPYTVGAVPPRARPSKIRVLILGCTNVVFGAIMNTLVRLVITVCLLCGAWHTLPWAPAAYLTYVAASLEAIVFALKTVWRRR